MHYQISNLLADNARDIAPGILLAFTIATAASFLSLHYGAPVMLFALLIGMSFHFLSEDIRCAAGINFTAGQLLRIGVALLGTRITLSQIMSLGTMPVVLVPALIMSTILLGLVIARLFKRDWSFGLLTGGSVAICGASAALAIASVLPKKITSERDTLFTIIAVTSLSTFAMIAYPIFFKALGFGEVETGVLIGATIHDVAQVVGAGYAVSEVTGDVATYVKLLRVAMLPVIVIIIAVLFRSREGNDGQSPFPWFAVFFAIFLLLNSAGLIPEPVRQQMENASRWFLIAAISALGVKTSIEAVIKLGAGHIIIVITETLFLFSVATVVLTYIGV